MNMLIGFLFIAGRGLAGFTICFFVWVCMHGVVSVQMLSSYVANVV